MNEVLRQEKKYPIDAAQGAMLRARLDRLMLRDAHNGAQGYRIRSLYFDTLDDQDFSDKVDGLELRRKIRLRAYSPDADFAMLEIKQKQGPYQRKRSLRLSRADADGLCRGDYRPLIQYDDPFAAECYGLLHCRCYRPKAVVEYRRQAYIARKTTSASRWTAASRVRETSFDLFSRNLPQFPVMGPVPYGAGGQIQRIFAQLHQRPARRSPSA